MDESVLRLNLSYVLREPSTSRSVIRLSRIARRFERRRSRLLRTFENVTDAEFREHIVIHPTLLQELQQWDATGSIITATVGLPTLLPRALQVVSDAHHRPPMTTVDQHAGGEYLTEASIFNACAHLMMKTEQAQQGPVFVGGLVVRPGERDTMLVGAVLDEASPRDHTAVTMQLEDVIRDFADQWTPPHALWQLPMEQTHPEILEHAPTQGSSP